MSAPNEVQTRHLTNAMTDIRQLWREENHEEDPLGRAAIIIAKAIVHAGVLISLAIDYGERREI
jgi:hypothetical protein